MAIAGIADDIIKGIKKFGDDVIEGAKNGPGKAARIKRTVTTLDGNRVKSADILREAKKYDESIINKAKNGLDSLSDFEKKRYETLKPHIDSKTGGIKRYNDVAMNDLERLKNVTPEMIENARKGRSGFISNDMLNMEKRIEEMAKNGTLKAHIENQIEEGGESIGKTIGDFTGGGLYGSYSAYKNMADGKKSIVGALKEGHSVVNDAGEKVISGKKVAGTATTVAAAGTLGNRVFRDEYGELDVPVVPFI